MDYQAHSNNEYQRIRAAYRTPKRAYRRHQLKVFAGNLAAVIFMMATWVAAFYLAFYLGLIFEKSH